jgi:hypothetical protein
MHTKDRLKKCVHKSGGGKLPEIQPLTKTIIKWQVIMDLKETE